MAYIDFRGIRMVEVYTSNLTYLQVDLWNVALFALDTMPVLVLMLDRSCFVCFRSLVSELCKVLFFNSSLNCEQDHRGNSALRNEKSE